jgi:UDP-N-acetylmuramoylalanine--D-glutamate ligase
MLTSLYPEHLDWHLSIENYFRDKVNLLRRGACRIINSEAATKVERLIGAALPRLLFNEEAGFHAHGARIVNGREIVGDIRNSYLARPHNRANLCAALAVMSTLGIKAADALDAAAGFRGLPHRQEELGELAGVLFVDDSISTIPEATIAALAVYAGRPISVIVGGYDRGIEYEGLVETLLGGAASAIICLGDSGQRIYTLARELADRRPEPHCAIHRAQSMADAVSFARQVTPPGGVILLSPGAPSYGQYRDYIERGHDFAATAGLRLAAQPDNHSHSE